MVETPYKGIVTGYVGCAQGFLTIAHMSNPNGHRIGTRQSYVDFAHTVGACTITPMLCSHIPNTARASYISNIPQHGIDNHVDLHITVISLGILLYLLL